MVTVGHNGAVLALQPNERLDEFSFPCTAQSSQADGGRELFKWHIGGKVVPST